VKDVLLNHTFVWGFLGGVIGSVGGTYFNAGFMEIVVVVMITAFAMVLLANTGREAVE